VLPQMGKLRRLLGNVRFELYSGRTSEHVRRLADMSLDLGRIREDAVTPPLKHKRLLVMSYSLFVPQRLAAGVRESELEASQAGVPLATSIGGQFRERLETAASKARWPLQIELSCTSFTQAARAVKAGDHVRVRTEFLNKWRFGLRAKS